MDNKADDINEEEWELLRLQEESDKKGKTQRLLLKNILTGEIKEVKKKVD